MNNRGEHPFRRSLRLRREAPHTVPEEELAMEATITPTHTRQILRTATAVTLGAAIGALFTIGINAVLTGDDSSETRAARGPAIASYNLPATADAAEHWLTTDRSGVDAHATPLSADAAEHWLTTDRSGVDAHATPLSADAAEHWLTTDRSGVDAHATPLSAPTPPSTG